jgi:type 1 glutamine amidotransferase
MLISLPLALAVLAAPSPAPKQPPRLLVVTVTKGFRHESIPDLERLMSGLASESHAFEVDFARTDEELAAKAGATARAGLAGIVFASTTGDIPLPDRESFPAWIESGHALIGLHAATDTFPGFPAYLDLIGGQFKHHGPQAKVQVHVRDPKHAATQGLADPFEVFDEIYQFQRLDPARLHVLLGLDAHPETGAPGSFPLAWTREPGSGRVFYTALGHRPDVIEAPWFRRHVLAGILWALGSAKGTGARP